jgi:hypothetical protein
MNRNQIENIYKANGLDDYQLRNTIDLLKVHGIDTKAVEGYDSLDDINKALYEKFIINFLNRWGMEARATIIPERIQLADKHLLFDYKLRGCNEWLHVTGEDTWY